MGESNLKRALKNLGLIFGIVIILYLLLVAFPIARAVRPQMNVRQTKNLLQVMKMGCDAYFKSFGQWPTSLSELYHNRSNIVFVSWAESYTNDAWDRPIVFKPFDPNVGYGTLVSYGRDGRPGGAGLDADIEFRFGEGKQ